MGEHYNITAAIISALTGLLAVVLGFIFKNRKQNMDHLTKSWEELVEDNASFREEIRKDLQVVKSERDALVIQMRGLDNKLSEVVKENVLLRKREIELTCEIKFLKEDNIRLRGKIEEQEKLLVLLQEKGNENKQTK